MFPGSNIAYYLMYIVGFAVMMVIDVKTCGSYGIKKKTAVGYTLYTYFAGVAGAMIMGSIYTAVSHAYGYSSGSRVAIFGAVIFTPLFLLIMLMFTKSDKRRVMDMLTPGIFIILACAKFGCFLYGCCPGFVCESGIYNPHLGKTVFPEQLLESLSMIVLIVLLQLIFKRTKRFVPGTAYPITAAAYSVFRFCWEEARYYEAEELSNIVFGLTFWQLWCIGVFIVSIAVTAVLLAHERRRNKIH